MKRYSIRPTLLALSGLVLATCLVYGDEPVVKKASRKDKKKPTSSAADAPAALNGDWTQWGGSSVRNNAPEGQNIPIDWDVGDIDRKTQEWKPETSRNIKWVARLGSQSYGNPVVADGKVYLGTNNGAGWLKHYPASIDVSVLLCFDEKNGQFLWQHSSEKLPTGKVHDWPEIGTCSTPLVEGDRLWYVTQRCEIVCLDTGGFLDEENDGPFIQERVTAKDEADVVWRLDMMAELGVSPHNSSSCSITSAGDLIFVCTSNGINGAHAILPAPKAPSFLCMDKNTGKVFWSDNSPGLNILHGQWSSPAYAILGDVPQVIFAGGDGWLYSFLAEATAKPELLWKFDCNPKKSKYSVSGRSDRNHIIGSPLIHDGLVYIAVGEDPEHLQGEGHLWCVDPTKRGDISTELVFNAKDPEKPIPHKRMQACVEEEGDFTRPNPNAAAVWHFTTEDSNGNGEIDYEETMHRTCGTATIKDGLLFIADFSGVIHCLDAKTGKHHWGYDMLGESWSTALVVDGHVYIGDADGDVSIFNLSADPQKAMKSVVKKRRSGDITELKPIAEISMGSAVYSTAIVANNTLFIASRTHVYAIENLADAPAAGDPAAAEAGAGAEKPADAGGE